MKTEVPLAVNRGNLSSRTGDSVQLAWLCVSMQTEQNNNTLPSHNCHNNAFRLHTQPDMVHSMLKLTLTRHEHVSWLTGESVISLSLCTLSLTWHARFRVGKNRLGLTLIPSHTEQHLPACLNVFEECWFPPMLVSWVTVTLPKSLSGCTGHDTKMDYAAAVNSIWTVWLMPRHVIVLWQISSLYFSLSLPHIILSNDQRGNHTGTFTVSFFNSW